MRRNKHRIKQLSLYLAVLTLFLFASCGTEPEREDQVVSERAVELFNLGIASYQEENFSGESRAYAVLKNGGGGRELRLLFADDQGAVPQRSGRTGLPAVCPRFHKQSDARRGGLGKKHTALRMLFTGRNQCL